TAPDRPPDAAPRPEAPQGLSASVSRVFNAPVSVVYNEWSTAPRRRRWAADAMLSVRKATQNKSMRITWDADATEVDVTFTSQGPEKCLVVVDHSKLRSPARAAELKAFWGEAMERLKALVVKA
ncbi:MAG TPA: hypothetical protein DEB06_02520, partial [Phycisphaerales bacterium]|nr:hypothetical protein [Phycisphaerales bacterium]